MERGIPFWLLLFLLLRVGETISTTRDDTINVNATVGSTAILPCRTVSNVPVFHVIWRRKGDSHPLTIDSRRFVPDNRISIERPFLKDWNLRIRDVRPSDQGVYACVYSRTYRKLKEVFFNVLVPSEIEDHLTSSDVTAQEGVTVTLVCRATGIPSPKVTWFSLPPDLDVRRQSELCKVTDNKPHLTHLCIDVIW